MDKFMTAKVIRQSRLSKDQKMTLHEKCIQDLEIEIGRLLEEAQFLQVQLFEHEAEYWGYKLDSECPCPACKETSLAAYEQSAKRSDDETANRSWSDDWHPYAG